MQGSSPILAKIIHSWYKESKNGWNFLVHHWPWLIIWKWHFWEKIVLKRELLHFLSTFISGNKYHRWAQQSFLELTVLLSNSSGEKNINSTERLAQGASAVCNKDFKLQISAQHSWSVPNLLRGRPTDLSSKTVVQFHRIDNSKKPETVTRHCLNFCPNKPLSSYLWWPMMKSNFYPFFRF